MQSGSAAFINEKNEIDDSHSLNIMVHWDFILSLGLELRFFFYVKEHLLSPFSIVTSNNMDWDAPLGNFLGQGCTSVCHAHFSAEIIYLKTY